ncbi:hypothetical protein [Streptomyces sp. NPDC001815]
MVQAETGRCQIAVQVVLGFVHVAEYVWSECKAYFYRTGVQACCR